ncbi:hypothetical protein CRG98_010036 [Punica granatum]|uniref:Uncharacterized protein n=1 Tax=Punica granatum TaxID=22663 RepID=A0A2I0KMN7_PUNGR|nr:hypothetical protein CRG98_010036 [Punica granatum]
MARGEIVCHTCHMGATSARPLDVDGKDNAGINLMKKRGMNEIFEFALPIQHFDKPNSLLLYPVLYPRERITRMKMSFNSSLVMGFFICFGLLEPRPEVLHERKGSPSRSLILGSHPSNSFAWVMLGFFYWG